MCYFPDCHHHGSTSSGVTAEGFLATFAILGSVALAGAIFQALWVPIGVAILAGWICVTPRLRRVVFTVCGVAAAGGLWVLRQALRRRRKPGKAVALPRAYRADLWIETPDGRNVPLLSGPVPGTWSSAAHVKAEIVQRWIARHGEPAAGRLVCVAEPAGDVQ